MQRSQINYINNALSLNRIRDVPYSYIKLNSSEVLVDTIFGNFKLKELFNRICHKFLFFKVLSGFFNKASVFC